MRDRRPRFPFARPLVPRPQDWLPYLDRSYDERWFSNNGPLVQRLEQTLVDEHALPGRAVATAASATAGLVGALLALDVRGPVALPSFTFPATAHAVELAGCVPVLCDVDAATWELAPEAAADAIRRSGCVAVVHVRSFGLCRDLGPIREVAETAGIPLVVDSAAAFGGVDERGGVVGRDGAAEVFSFHATKVFAVGEGGAIVGDPELVAKARHAMNFALADGEVTGRGLNGKMSETTAAVALAMRDQFDRHLACRRSVVTRLLAAARTAGLPFTLPSAPGRPPWQGLPLLLETAALRERALRELTLAGVEARPYYAPGLHRTRAFGGCAAGDLPVTDGVSDRILCLPVYSDLAGDELDDFATVVHDALAATVAGRQHGLSRR